MQYYYLKTKLNLGDIIDFNGLKVEVTMNLIKANPELFVVEEELLPEYVECIKTVCSSYTLGKIYKIIDHNNFPKQISIIGDDNYGKDIYCWDEGYLSCNNNCFKPSTPKAFQKQELLEEAKKRYPVGTRFKSAYSGDKFKITSDGCFKFTEDWDIYVVDICDPFIYYRGKWAEILTPLFQTEDGFDIYEGNEYWYVQTGGYTLNGSGNLYPWEIRKNGDGILNLSNPKIKRFSNRQAAEAWLESNKPKDLQYYEDLLLGTPDYFTRGKNIVIAKRDFYFLLKEQEPRLYYQKVLELIQQDLDNDWKPDWKNFLELKYHIHYRSMQHSTYDVESNTILNTGVIYFKSEKSAQRAIDLMGEKLDTIFL